jgi:hypothetical protein
VDAPAAAEPEPLNCDNKTNGDIQSMSKKKRRQKRSRK